MFTYLPSIPPCSPSLISLMVSVDIKHHVYSAMTTLMTWAGMACTGWGVGGWVVQTFGKNQVT